jgi:CRP-like cAMP-binding protein
VKESLGEMPLFAGLDPRLLRKLEESAIACLDGKGEVIIREGEMGLGMYVILTGRVEVTQNQQGSAKRLAELGPTQVFAAMSLIDDQPSPTTITTLEETECLLITRQSFKQLMNKNPRLAIHLARILVERLGRADEFGQVVGDAPPPSIPRGPASPAWSDSSADAVTGASVKAAIEEKMLSTFERLYMVKAFTRFSVAVLGCPVEGSTSNLVDEIRVGDVKALIVPAGEPVEVRIEAFGAGSFSLHVFTPELAAPIRFGPVPIQPRDLFTLRLLPFVALAKGEPRDT